MPATFTWDATVFNRTLKTYLEHTSLTIAQAMNKKGYDLVLQAGALTKKADVATIKAEIGPIGSRLVGQKIRITKKGVKRGRMMAEKKFPDLLYAIAVKSMGAGATWEEIQNLAERIYGARIRSAAYIKQGWIPAKEILRRSDRGGDNPSGWEDPALKRVGRLGASIQRGGADAAQRSFHPTVVVWNWVTNSPRTDKKAFAIGNEGLQKAFDKVTADMMAYIDRKLGKPTAIFNAAQKRK